MLYIKAKHKTTGTEYRFTATQWYDAQQTGDYNYLGTIHIADSPQPLQQNTTTAKRGCGCANKNKK